MADAMQKQIEAWGNQCQCVTDFRNVIPAFASYDPHLVLMDIMLPFFNGYHCLRCGIHSRIKREASSPYLLWAVRL